MTPGHPLDSHLLTRRQFSLGTVLAGATLAMPCFRSVGLASQADLASTGLPTLDVTINVDGFEGIPDTLEAGRYLINATVAADVGEEGAAIAFLQPYNMTADEFFGAIGGPAAGASPAAEASPPAAGGEEGGDEEEPEILPTFVYQSKFAGGVAAPSGESASGVIDLTPGEWIAWGDDPEASQQPVVLNVTGDLPAEMTEPDADIMVTLVDFAITVEGTLTAGDHIVRIENQGAQPHFFELDTVPAGTTNDDLNALIEGFMTGTPPADGVSEEDFTPVVYTPTQSIGTVTWHMLSLEAGTYAASCWFPTAGVGDPHAFHGMHTVFEVTG
jgi:hypothetical protein